MFGIIVAMIIKIICNCKSVGGNRNRGSLILRRRRLQTVQIIPQPINSNLQNSDSDSDSDTDKYSITIDDELEETKEETKENLSRIPQNV